MTTDACRPRRPGVFARSAAVGACILSILAAGCTASSDDATGSAGPTGGASDSVADAAPTEAAATAQAIISDPQGALTQAIAGLGTSYTFASVVSTESGDEVTVTGYRIAESSSYEIIVDGEAVQVISIAGDTWVLEANSDNWLQADSSQGGDPLQPLATPQSIAADDTGTLTASYDATLFATNAAGTLEVSIVLGGPSVTFTSTDGPLQMRTTLTAKEPLPAIVAPA